MDKVSKVDAKLRRPRIPIKLERDKEALRQERESFEQQRIQSAMWFRLRLVMGYSAIVLLLLVSIVSSYILVSSSDFSPKVVVGAGTALFLNVLGLLVSIFKIALKPDYFERLSPTTQVKDQAVVQSKSDTQL